MYIWILLATIMVALSFFNLSPRSDVEHAVNEVKAAVVVNRFRAEHIAMVHTIECEVISRKFGSSTDPLYQANNNPIYLNSSPHNLKTGEPLKYTKYQCNLPIGYVRDSSSLTVHHELACTAKKLEEEDNQLKNCRLTSNRYAVSYAQIPDRWLSKEVDEKDGVSVRPLPSLIGLVAKSTGAGTVYGWTECSGVGSNMECRLHGYSVKIGSLIDDEISDGISSQIMKKLVYKEIDPKSPIWPKMSNFVSECSNSNKPCLFAYERMPTYDKGLHCKVLMQKTDSTCEFLGLFGDGISD